MASLILGLSGPRACGKSTISNHLVSNHGYTRVAFSDSLREIVSVFDKSLENDRVLLSKLGQKIRELQPNFILDVVRNKINTIEGPVVIEDIRFPSEMDFCNKLGCTIRFEIDVNTQKKNLIDRGKNENYNNLVINCKDESALEFVSNDEWTYILPAVGDFTELAADIDIMIRRPSFE